jgi:hypothetical protein
VRRGRSLRPDLSRQDSERLKQVATALLVKPKAEKLCAKNWWEKQGIREVVEDLRVTL